MTPMWLDKKRGYLQDWITQQWVKITGIRVRDGRFDFLKGPYGHTDQIGDKFVQELVEKEALVLYKNRSDAGLMPNAEAFALSEAERARINPRILDFYTRTIHYRFEVWSKWATGFQWIGQLLSILFSKRLRQLNLPLDPIESSRGVDSNIYQLKEADGTTRHTIWYRILRSTQRVIYSGIYSTVALPGLGRLVKVVFPLPNGNATVLMQRQVLPDGSLRLVSAGKRAGGAGFYFTIYDHEKGKYWVKFVRAVRETIHVFEEGGELRTDHELHFYGLLVFKLHYKIIGA